MPKGPQGQKRKTTTETERPSANAISRWENEGGATKKLPRNVPEDPIARGLEALLKAYREEIVWLFQKAEEYQENAPVAADYIHRAKNLQAVIDAYERLDANDAKPA